MKTFLVAMSVAIVLSPVRAEGPTYESRIGRILPLGIELPAPPPAVIGAPVPYAAQVSPSAAPDVSVSLPPLLNAHWKAAGSIGQGKDKMYLSGQLDLAGNAYFAIFGEGWAGPLFYKIERGMYGRWRHNGAIYNVSLDVSIWRKRLNNYIVIEKEEHGAVYSQRIADMFEATYKAGKAISVADQKYRLFYSNNVDTSKSPAVKDKDHYGFLLVYDDEGDYKFYLIPREKIVGDVPVSYKMFGNKILKFRVTKDFSTLEISR